MPKKTKSQTNKQTTAGRHKAYMLKGVRHLSGQSRTPALNPRGR
jgi:hypothetical protein